MFMTSVYEKNLLTQSADQTHILEILLNRELTLVAQNRRASVRLHH